MRQLAFLVVGSLVLWYLGHYGINAVLQVVYPDLSAATSRILDLALVPLGLLVSWLVMRRLEPAAPAAEEPTGGGPDRSDAG